MKRTFLYVSVILIAVQVNTGYTFKEKQESSFIAQFVAGEQAFTDTTCFGDNAPCKVSGCTVPVMPSFEALPAHSMLPDPFTFMDGSKVSDKSDWKCRREEIAVMAQEYEYGYKPCTPKSATTGSFKNDTLTVAVSENGKSISFKCPITYPGTGSAPYPVMIGVGRSSLNNELLLSMGVAIINFPNNDIAEQKDGSSRGKGKFYELYCHNHSAGAMMAWAWGVSRLIDAIEKTPDTNIDPKRVGVTGCSRNGKGALTAGVFDDRIALTIPQESGAGGSTSWRFSDDMFARGQNTQTIAQINRENVWFRESFRQFSESATKLPYDHHMIQGLIAPRALLIIENEILWLGPESSWTCANAAHLIWEALGVPDRMGYSGTKDHRHCAYPASQEPELIAFVKKFLIGNGTDDTKLMKTEPGHAFDKAKWIDWTVPSL